MEALRRPGEQRGYGVEMDGRYQDLNLYSGAHAFRFWHTSQASMEIWQRTQGSDALFPYDPMAEKLRNMREYRIYSEEGLRLAFDRVSADMCFDEAYQELERIGCTFVKRLPFAYTEKEIVYISDLFEGSEEGSSIRFIACQRCGG